MFRGIGDNVTYYDLYHVEIEICVEDSAARQKRVATYILAGEVITRGCRL